jgi:hypothetical protein
LLIYAQDFKSYGINTSYTFGAGGWENPDSLGSYYHDKVYINTFSLGFYGEFLNKKYNSTMVDVNFRWRQYFFEYDKTPNANDARLIYNDMYFISMAAYEKIKYDVDRWSVYAFGGLRANLRYKNSVEKDIQSIFFSSKSVTFAATMGIGFRKRIERFMSVSVDLYYDRDFTKMYESSTGYVRNNEFGIRIGFGPFNPAKK